jgi:chromosome segregation ATPase
LERLPGQLLEATQQTREESFRDALREEEHKAALLDKERAAKKRAWELRIEALNRTIAEQKAKLADLTGQWQAASTQAQQLAMTAVTTGKEHGGVAG